MAEQPFLALLNRDEAAGLVSQHYGPQIELLTQLTNYASNLIPRAFHSSEKQMRDVIVCLSLLKQFTTMMDGVDVLTRAGNIQAAFVPARAAFEASLYIEWMLVSDGQTKAIHYYVGEIRQQRIWGERATAGTAEAEAFLKEMGTLGQDILAAQPALTEQATKHLDQVGKILEHEWFAAANAAFEEFKIEQNHGREPHWYQVLGKRSIKAIAKELQRLPEYIIYYGKGSRVVHSQSYDDQMKFTSKGANVLPVRYIADIHTLLNFACGNAMTLFARILGFYRNGELTAFSRQYVEEWRDAYRSIPHALVGYQKLVSSLAK